MEPKYESPFRIFSKRFLTGKDDVKFLLGLKALVLEDLREGTFKRPLKTSIGTILVVYYYDSENDILHILAAYIDRKGEPSPSLKGDINTLIRALGGSDDQFL